MNGSVMFLLSDNERRSLVILDSDVHDDEYTISGLSADTTYTLLLAAVSVTRHSENTVITNVTTTATDALAAWQIALAVVAAVPVTLALIGIYACGRYA